MSFYEERFNAHQVHNTLSTLKTRIENLISGQKDESILEHLNRLMKIISYTGSALKLIDPDSTPESTLNQLNKICNNINTDLNNFDNDNNIDHLSAANTPKADNVLIQLQQLPKVIPQIDVEEHKTALANLSKSITNIISEINQKRDQFEKKLDGYKKVLDQLENSVDQQNKNIENQKSRLDTVVSQFQSQFSEAEDRRRESFENTIKNYNEEHKSFRNNMQNDLSSFKKERQSEVTKTINKFNEDTENSIKLFKEDSENLIKSLKDESDTTINYLSDKRDEATKLLNIIANIGSTGNYNKIANEERTTANVLRVIAICFMITGIVVISSVVFNFAKSGFDWKQLLSRVGVTIIILVPAFYIAKESSNHRNREILNRKMELELASIGPYLELLPEEKKNELRATLTEKFFGQPDLVDEKSDNVTAGPLFKLLEKLTTLLAKK